MTTPRTTLRRPGTRSRLRLVPAAALLALGLALPARAQDKPRADEKPAGKPDEAPKPEEKSPESRFTGQIVDFLKGELDLSADQTAKVSSIMEDAMKEGMKLAMKRMGEEQPDPEAMKKDQEALRERIVGQIREILDDPQKKELDSLLKDFESRSGRFERAQNNAPGGDAALWLEGEHPSRDSLLAHAEKALILSQDEHRAIFPLIEKVVDARIKLRDQLRSNRKDLAVAVHGGAKQDEIKERLHILRQKEVVAREDLEKAEAELREVVTLDQETRLVAIGVLD